VTMEKQDASKALEVMPPGAVDAMQQRLLRAFADHHGRARRPVSRVWTRWAAIAAALLLLVVGIARWRASGARPSMLESAAPAPAPASEASRLVPPATRPAADRQSVPIRTAAAQPSRARPGRGSAATRAAAFVALPGAASLPQFESGSIVRMELPLSSLAAYGVDISGAAGTAPVETDVLVGQDGEPRAIRLVSSTSTRSSTLRSRQ
jgi:hypothetical protein